METIARLMRQKRMALFIAEVGNVYDGSGVGGNELQGLAGFETFQPFPRFQHRKRADQAGGVEFIFGHDPL